jgi:tRNA-splicing ligase RtcB
LLLPYCLETVMAKLSRADIESACSTKEMMPRQRVRRDRNPALPQSKPAVGALQRTTPGGRTIHVWTDALDTVAWKQAASFADLPFVHPHGVALMPDVHPGKGVPVGCVLPTVGALVPAAVGVDIGCGMIAVRLDVLAHQLPTSLRPLRSLIEASCAVDGFGRHKAPTEAALAAWQDLQPGHAWLASHHRPAALGLSSVRHLGSLGGGNHFIEVCVDQEHAVWVMLHSGSRGIGAAVGRHFIDAARRRVQENGGTTVAGLGWFDEADPWFADYARAVAWAQDVARVNRELMLSSVLEAMTTALGRPVRGLGQVVSCHHNYVSLEQHFGQQVWITRKGAISARAGEMGIIPAAMGKESLIVAGLGSQQAWCSCSHGAGRAMTRRAAKDRFTAADLRRQTNGVECRKTRDLVDEIPSAYKPLAQVMANQRDLVEVRHRIRAVLCVKGA